MKIKDVIKETNTLSDLTAGLRSDPNNDNQTKTNSDNNRRPVITLRHINTLKKMKTAQLEEYQKRKKILDIMYGSLSSGDDE